MILNDLEKEIVSMAGSAMFGLPGAESLRNGPEAQPRTLGVGWLLYAFVRAARPKTILEIGTGGSSACLLWGLKHNKFGHLHTCDVFASGQTDDKHLAAFLKEEDGRPMNHNKADCLRMIKKWEMEDLVTIHHKCSKNLAAEWNQPIDMLVVDGNHEKDFVENDAGFLYFLNPGGFGLFHDFLGCIWEVGGTLRDLVAGSDEWTMIVEPNCLSLGIVQRKFSVNSKNALVAWKLSQAGNPNAERTPIQATCPRDAGMIGKWNGSWFPDNPADYHKDQAEAEKVAEEIMRFEKSTGVIVRSMDEWTKGGVQ